MTLMRVTTTFDEGDRVTLAVSGELVLDTADRLAGAITAVLAGPGCGRLVVDLGQVTFLDMAGLNVLLRGRVAARRAGVSLRICEPQPRVRRVLEITGTYGLLAGGRDSRTATVGAVT